MYARFCESFVMSPDFSSINSERERKRSNGFILCDRIASDRAKPADEYLSKHFSKFLRVNSSLSERESFFRTV